VSQKKTAFAFVIRPPWWRTWWYRSLLALAAAGALASLWRWRVYRLVVRQRELEAAVAERTRQLREQAIKDRLTGLFNRNAFFEVLERELSKIRRKGGDLALIMGDLDHFKSINDTHSHQAGDAVLKDSAHRILQCVRVYDTVGRYGGEELAVLMPGCCLEEAASRAEELRKSIANTPFDTMAGPVAATCSFGVTVAFAGCDSVAALARLSQLTGLAAYKSF
jgi:diguanylate cyclase (GGDEF)-like protein